VIAPELNAPLSETTECVAVSVFVHITAEPTEILIGFGVNPPFVIVAFIVVPGAVGELPLPHPIVAINNIAAHIILIRIDIIVFFLPACGRAKTSPCAPCDDAPGRGADTDYGWLTRNRRENGERKPAVGGRQKGDCAELA
jgi:hypothetical protein